MNCPVRYSIFSSHILFGAVVAAALVSFCLAPSSFAAPINYGDFPGTSVTFLDVTEDSTPLFGAPTLAGDSLSFNPVSFNATSSLAHPLLDFTAGTLATTILAHPGKFIHQIRLTEAGDYILMGTGTSMTQVTVSTTLFGNILEVDGIGISPISFNATMTFTPNADGSFNLADGSGVWRGSALLDVQAELVAEGIAGRATKVQFSMGNTLLAMSEAGSTAVIAKKRSDGVIIEVVAPEPSTLVLLGLGLVGLVMWRRRR